MPHQREQASGAELRYQVETYDLSGAWGRVRPNLSRSLKIAGISRNARLTAVGLAAETAVADYLDPEGNIAIPDGVTLTSYLDRNIAALVKPRRIATWITNTTAPRSN